MEIVKLPYTPQSLLPSMINSYKMGKAICARFVVANLGNLVSYHDKSGPEHTAKRKQQRKCQHQTITVCATLPNKQNDFVTTRKIKYACVMHLLIKFYGAFLYIGLLLCTSSSVDVLCCLIYLHRYE